jgi:5'-nucleotidase/UDP-sugar diphosphatase
MAPLRRRLAALGAALAVAAAMPAGAVAQSAGDDQYQDPFAGQGGGAEPDATPAPADNAPAASDAPTASEQPAASAPDTSDRPAASAPDTSDQSAASAPAASAPAASEPATSAPAAAAHTVIATPAQLPYTGAPPGLLALAGGAALLAGLGLRLRLRDDPRQR